MNKIPCSSTQKCRLWAGISLHPHPISTLCNGLYAYPSISKQFDSFSFQRGIYTNQEICSENYQDKHFRNRQKNTTIYFFKFLLKLLSHQRSTVENNDTYFEDHYRFVLSIKKAFVVPSQCASVVEHFPMKQKIMVHFPVMAHPQLQAQSPVGGCGRKLRTLFHH